MCNPADDHYLSDTLPIHYQVRKKPKDAYLWGAMVCLKCGGYFKADTDFYDGPEKPISLEGVSYADLRETLLFDIDDYLVITSRQHAYERWKRP